MADLVDVVWQSQKAHDQETKWLHEEIKKMREMLAAMILKEGEIVIYDRWKTEARNFRGFEVYEDKYNRCTRIREKPDDG